MDGIFCIYSQVMLDEEEKKAPVKMSEEMEQKVGKAEAGEDAKVASEMMGELEALLSGGPPPSSKSQKRYTLLCIPFIHEICFR